MRAARLQVGTHARRRGRWVLAASVAAGLLLGACGTAGSVGPVAQKPLVVLPKGAEIAHPTPPPLSQDCTASLAPPAVMPAPGHMPQGTYMAQIQARGFLLVGVDQNTYLWGYRDPTTGTLSGFDIDMLRQVSQAIFGSTDPKYIRFKIVPNADRFTAVQKGQVDILAETTTITCERWQKVDFSSVYYEAAQRILVPSNSKITGPQDLGGKRVCAIVGSTSLRNLVKAGMPRHVHLWEVNNETDCLVMLQQGQVDAISTDDAILYGLQAQDPNTKILGSTFSSEPYGMAISKVHPEFTQFVNGILAQVRANGTWAQIYTADLAQFTKSAAPAPPPARYR
jgi:polar amino acid transport system substrate-binding protein